MPLVRGVRRYRKGDVLGLHRNGLKRNPGFYEIAEVTFSFWRFVRVYVWFHRWDGALYQSGVPVWLDHTDEILPRLCWSFAGWVWV